MKGLENVAEDPEPLCLLGDTLDDEALRGSDEDPDVPREKVTTMASGVRGRIRVDRHDATITAKTPRKIPYYPNGQWRQTKEETQRTSLSEHDRRQRKKRTRGAMGDWVRRTAEQ